MLQCINGLEITHFSCIQTLQNCSWASVNSQTLCCNLFLLYHLFLKLQIPGIMNHATFLDPCTNGVRYALLMITPSFYLLAALLFMFLGMVIVTWGTCRLQKTAAEQDITSVAETFKNKEILASEEVSWYFWYFVIV